MAEVSQPDRTGIDCDASKSAGAEDRMRFEKLDLNLLVALDALIAERSVSNAAIRLHLTQPALSSALNRLRKYFSDELLVKAGRQMILTPLARQLAEPIRRTLTLVRSQITTGLVFDPATAERRFVIQASDYIFDLILARAFVIAADEAPGVMFDVVPIDTSAPEQLEHGDIDLAVAIKTQLSQDRPFAMDHPHRMLFSDDHALICWAGGNYGDVIDEADFFRAGHVAVHLGSQRTLAFTEQLLAIYGIGRRTELIVPNFRSLPRAVIGTKRLAIIFRRYAELLATMMPIAIRPLPFQLPIIQAYVQWNKYYAEDEGIRWLIGLLKRCANELDQPLDSGSRFPA